MYDDGKPPMTAATRHALEQLGEAPHYSQRGETPIAPYVPPATPMPDPLFEVVDHLVHGVQAVLRSKQNAETARGDAERELRLVDEWLRQMIGAGGAEEANPDPYAHRRNLMSALSRVIEDQGKDIKAAQGNAWVGLRHDLQRALGFEAVAVRQTEDLLKEVSDARALLAYALPHERMDPGLVAPMEKLSSAMASIRSNILAEMPGGQRGLKPEVTTLVALVNLLIEQHQQQRSTIQRMREEGEIAAKRCADAEALLGRGRVAEAKLRALANAATAAVNDVGPSTSDTWRRGG